MSSEPRTTQLHCYSFFFYYCFKGCGFLCGTGWPRTLCNLSCLWTCDQHASASRVLRLLLYVHPVAFSSLMFSLSFSNTFVIFLAEYYFNSGLWKKKSKENACSWCFFSLALELLGFCGQLGSSPHFATTKGKGPNVDSIVQVWQCLRLCYTHCLFLFLDAY